MGTDREMSCATSRSKLRLGPILRLALLEALALEGPLTATSAGELIGESPTTCSFHFATAKYGFVEEAHTGPGRLRPWKIVNVGMRFTTSPRIPKPVSRRRASNAWSRSCDESTRELHIDEGQFSKVWQERRRMSNILWVTPPNWKKSPTKSWNL